MTESRLPILRGRISSVDSYEAPQGGGPSPSPLPSLDPKAHRDKLLQQLNLISQQVETRAGAARDELAKREIVAIRPAANAHLAPEQLDDSRSDAKLVGMFPDTGTVILDIADASLDYIRKKLDAFADDAKVTTRTDKDGKVTTQRDSQRAIAPLDSIGLADLRDICGPALRAAAPAADRPCWFEVGCRGGYRNPGEQSSDSRTQISRQLQMLGATQRVDEFMGPEQVYFFVRLARSQLDDLRRATDCIYEVDLAPARIRDLKLLDDLTTRDVANFVLKQPDKDAPSVVILDTGVATGHPLLREAILTATTAGPEIPSPEDTYGHGTKMAGLALFSDVGEAIERGRVDCTHWLQSSRILVAPGSGTAADDNYEKWPILTERAVRSAESADPRPRNRTFVLAVTRSMQVPPLDGIAPTLWSQAVDQLSFDEGRERLMIVSAGNARDFQWLALSEQHPQLQLSEKIHQPSQASNVLTVGAFTARVELPNDKDYAGARVVATKLGGISPYTSTGLVGSEWPIKPDVVFEGGNLAISGNLTDHSVPTLAALTTSHRHMHGTPVGLISMTSEASARIAHLATRIWSVESAFRPATIRGLIVHSASWTNAMIEDFPGLDDRLQACGYGVPSERRASQCAQGVATIVVEDSMPNAVIEEVPKKVPPKRTTTKPTEPKVRRRVKFYRLPLPDGLLGAVDEDVELRVTLSYFAEPNKFGRRTYHGLDLKWDMQGPQESAEVFIQRINALRRPAGPDGKRAKIPKSKSFDWDVGIERRSRGTVQSDRWRGKMSALVGDKLIAVVPVLGWWDQRKALKYQEMKFSLVISVFGPGVYAVIGPKVEVDTGIVIEM